MLLVEVASTLLKRMCACVGVGAGALSCACRNERSCNVWSRSRAKKKAVCRVLIAGCEICPS